MDKLDIKIISLLQQDGTTTNAGIAKQVGVSEETVRRRFKRLTQEKYISVVAVPDPTKMGFDSEALIGFQVEADKIEFVAESLADLNEISWVSITTGSFDIFAWATLRTSDALSEFIRQQVGCIAGIRRIETFINLSNKKRQHGLAM